MATYHIDLVNGNDANSGTSWAQAWKTISSGPTAARTTQGDVIRISKTPDPVALGQNALWSGDVKQSLLSCSAQNGSNPARLTKTAHGLVTGDYVFGYTTSSPQSELNGMWQVNVIDANTFTLVGGPTVNIGYTYNFFTVTTRRVKLDAAVTKHVNRCNDLWTTSSSSTITLQTGTGARLDGRCVQIVVPAYTTNTRYAYAPVANADLSAYSQISFSVRHSATLAANRFRICLCSDAAGTNIVHSFPIPQSGAVNRWHSYTVDNGGPLSDNIQSVALYTMGGTGASITFNIDNILAVKAASDPSGLDLTHLISKNTGTEAWWCIGAIDDEYVILEGDISNPSNPLYGQTNARGQYYGTTETVTLYKRETFKTAIATGLTTVVNTINEGGTLALPISYEGGFDPATNTKSGSTYLDGTNGWGMGITCGANYLSFKDINMVRYNTAYNIVSGMKVSVAADDLSYNSNNAFAVSAGSALDLSAKNVLANTLAAGFTNSRDCRAVFASNIGCGGLTCSGSTNLDITLGATALNHSNFQATSTSYGIVFRDGKIVGQTGSFVFFCNTAVNTTISNVIMNAADNPGVTAIGISENQSSDTVFIEHNNGVIGDNRIAAKGTTLVVSTTGRDDNPNARKFTSSAVGAGEVFSLPMGKIGLLGGQSVTIGAWIKKTASMNTWISIKAGAIFGMAAQRADATLTNQWELVSFTFTPPHSGVVELFMNINATAFGHEAILDSIVIS